MPNSAGQRTTLARPRTSPARMSARHAVGKEEARPDDYEIELLEYEWPDLPPISTMKDAITRSRVSLGISYLLPVDKSKISINNHFRTDLRAMFQEPFASDDLGYNDSRVTLSAKILFRSNTVDTKWTKGHLKTIPVELNSESEKVRTLYTRSAPASASASRRMGLDPCKLRKRSNLYLPIKAKVPTESLKIRAEVEKILEGVQEDDGDYKEDNHEVSGHKGEVTLPTDSLHVEFQNNDRTELANPSASSLHRNLQDVSYSPYGKQNFASYEELRSAKPPSISIPESRKSEFLSNEKNQEIWSWLHAGEEMDDFDFFLSVCG